MSEKITTAEELDALPVGSVVRLTGGLVADKVHSHGDREWGLTGYFGPQPIRDTDLPAIVLHRPGADVTSDWGTWLTEHDAQVAARALREAAEVLFEDEDAGLNVVLGGPGYVHYWLREHADRIERQEQGR